jgi:ATP-binding cassette, subfamily C, bacterial LapB
MAQPQERPPGQSFMQRPQMQGDIELRNVSFATPAATTRCSTA